MKTIKQIVEDQKLHMIMYPDQVGECEECMAIAQKEILKEAVKRSYKNIANIEFSKIKPKFKSISEIVLELIKEIES